MAAESSSLLAGNAKAENSAAASDRQLLYVKRVAGGRCRKKVSEQQVYTAKYRIAALIKERFFNWRPECCERNFSQNHILCLKAYDTVHFDLRVIRQLGLQMHSAASAWAGVFSGRMNSPDAALHRGAVFFEGGRVAATFRSSSAARPGGRCFGQKATIFRSGRGD